jgi:hypothetical protein
MCKLCKYQGMFFGSTQPDIEEIAPDASEQLQNAVKEQDICRLESVVKMQILNTVDCQVTRSLPNREYTWGVRGGFCAR